MTSDNRIIGVADGKVQVEEKYRDITNLSELGYTFDNPNNIEYNQILLLNFNGVESTVLVITTDRFYMGTLSNNNIGVSYSTSDSAILDENFEVKDYL